MSVSRFDRVATGLCAIVAGPVILAGMATSVWAPDGSLESLMRSYLVDPTRSQVSAILLHFGYLLLLPAALGLASVTHATPRLRAFGLLFAIPGLATLPGLLAIDFYDLALAQTLTIGQAVAVEEQVNRYAGPYVLIIPTIVGMVVSFACLSIGAWRVRFIPWWTSALILLGNTASAVHRGTTLLPAAIEVGVLTIGLADLGRRLIWTPAANTPAFSDVASQSRRSEVAVTDQNPS
jgi:hypothetical protein